MYFDLNDKKMVDKCIRLGLSVPAESGEREFSDEEKLIIFKDQHMTTLDDVLLEIERERELASEIYDKETAGKFETMFSRILEKIKKSTFTQIPDGFWHLELDCEGEVMVLSVYKEKGYIDDSFMFVPDEVEEDFYLFCAGSDEITDDELPSTLYSLPETERKILEYRYGFADGRVRTTQEIQQELGFSSEEELMEVENDAREELW